jgi:integrase
MKLEPGVWKERDGRRNCWRVRITYKGHTLEDSFAKVADANAFVRNNKASIDATGRPANIRELRDMLLIKVFQNRIDDIYSRMPISHNDFEVEFARHYNDTQRIERIKKDRKETAEHETDLRILQKAIGDPLFRYHHVLMFKRKHVKEYIEKRKQDNFWGPNGDWKEPTQTAASTIKREISVFRKAFELLRDEHDHLINPFSDIGRISGKQHSFESRRLEVGELEALLESCKECLKLNKVYMPLAIFLAVETGMREGEILNLRWGDFDWNKEIITITRSKTDKHQKEPGRKIPLTYPVQIALGQLVAQLKISITPDTNTKVFGKWTSNALTGAWQDVRRRAMEAMPMKPLRFYDLRHEAVSRFKNFLTIPEYTGIVGHTVPGLSKTTQGYVHLNDDELRIIKDKLNKHSPSKHLWDNSLELKLSMLEQIQRLAFGKPQETPPTDFAFNTEAQRIIEQYRKNG